MNKDKLSRLFPDIMAGFDFHEWHEVFPSIIGLEPFLPQNFAEAEQDIVNQLEDKKKAIHANILCRCKRRHKDLRKISKATKSKKHII